MVSGQPWVACETASPGEAVATTTGHGAAATSPDRSTPISPTWPPHRSPQGAPAGNPALSSSLGVGHHVPVHSHPPSTSPLPLPSRDGTMLRYSPGLTTNSWLR